MRVLTSTRSRRAIVCLDLADQVVHLAVGRAHRDLGIHQPGRPDQLLHEHAAAALELERGRCRRHVDALADAGVELLEAQRPVVERAGQAEPEVHQRLLARAVAVVHAAHLRDRLVALVDHQQEIVGEVVEQRRRRLARSAARQVPRIVLDPLAVAELAQHLEVEPRPLLQALALQQLALRLQLGEALRQLDGDGLDRAPQPPAGRGVVRLGIERDLVDLLQHGAAQRVEAGHALDLVAEVLDADAAVLVGRLDLQHVAAHAEAAVVEVVRRALVLHLRQPAHRDVHPLGGAALEELQHAEEGLRRAEAVDARHRRHDQDVTPLEQRLGGAPAAGARSPR